MLLAACAGRLLSDSPPSLQGLASLISCSGVISVPCGTLGLFGRQAAVSHNGVLTAAVPRACAEPGVFAIPSVMDGGSAPLPLRTVFPQRMSSFVAAEDGVLCLGNATGSLAIRGGCQQGLINTQSTGLLGSELMLQSQAVEPCVLGSSLSAAATKPTFCRCGGAQRSWQQAGVPQVTVSGSCSNLKLPRLSMWLLFAAPLSFLFNHL